MRPMEKLNLSKDDLKEMIKEAKDKNNVKKVSVCSIPSRLTNEEAYSRSEAINNQMGSLCDAMDADYIDLRTELDQVGHWLHGDGVHYNRIGGMTVARKLNDVIGSFLG